MKLQGTIRYEDLEGGVWLLRADDGKQYLLAGGDRKLKKNGARAELEGKVDAGGVSAQMVGPIFHVSSYRFL